MFDVIVTEGQYTEEYLQVSEHEIVISHYYKGLLEIIGVASIDPYEEESLNDEHDAD